MEKVQLNSLKTVKLISNREASFVYLLSDGSVLKIFSSITNLYYKEFGFDLEGKILNSKQIDNVPEIVIPNSAVYRGSEFIGYTTKYIDGINYGQWDARLSMDERCNLLMYANVYSKIEDIIKRANEKNIVFPDLLTVENIIFTKDNEIKFIDYDGLQIDEYNGISISKALGEQKLHFIPKYERGRLHFTNNLDMKSLIFLYFITTFNISLFNIGKINRETLKPITVDDIFEMIGLDDDDIKHKVWLCFKDECPNVFLGDDVFKIAENYNMTCYPYNYGGKTKYIKRLERK